MDDKMQLKITGKNSDGEYWLHLVGVGQNAGFNLGDPATMVGAALLKAASGQRFVSVPSPADPVRDALVEALEFYGESDLYISFEGEDSTITCDGGKQARAALAAWRAVADVSAELETLTHGSLALDQLLCDLLMADTPEDQHEIRKHILRNFERKRARAALSLAKGEKP